MPRHRVEASPATADVVPTALVTGATAGLGAAFARQLAAEGHGLVLAARDAARLDERAEQLSTRYGVDVQTQAADLATDEGRAVVSARLTDPTRPIDVLINNAGIGLYRAFGKTAIEDERRLLELNVRAVMELCHSAVPVMRARGRGMIINLGSVGGLVPRPETTSYGAGKAYVIAFSQGLSALVKDSGVTVTVVCPGFTHTEFHERARVDMSYLPEWMWLDVEEVVATGLSDARRGKSLSVPSLRYKAITGLARVAPGLVVRGLSSAGKPKPRR
ncbi:MAG: SDR family oxidoreductase [Actinobacteria bacterium]|nr:SDR family oxidoreductase [Actinomycetota bacterium]